MHRLYLNNNKSIFLELPFNPKQILIFQNKTLHIDVYAIYRLMAET